MNVAFIVGSPRSGTTFLEEIFNKHPDVCGWHEPYFIWKYYLNKQDNDYLDESHVTNKIRTFIRDEFEYYLTHSNKKLLLEKTPNNAFKIRYMNNLFPEAKWIHIYRDGRDVVSSMKIRYQYRKELVLKKDFRKFIDDIYYTLKLQPFWRHRLIAIWHELKNVDHIIPYLNFTSSQWAKTVGWGPKYPNWEIDKKELSEIEFMAMQWLKSEEYINDCLKFVNTKNIFHLKYEDLLNDPQLQFENIAQFLELTTHDIITMANSVRINNSNKWKKSLSSEEIDLISPIVNDILDRYKYL